MTRRLAWTLVTVLVFTIPWEKSVWIPGVGTITRLIGLLALISGVAAAIVRRSVRPPNLLLILGVLFVGWEALTWFWSLDAGASAARALTLAQLLVMVWLIWDLCRGTSEQHQLLHAYVAGAVVASAYTIVRYALNQQTYWRRYAAAGFDPNDLGLTIALAIPFAFYMAFRGGPAAWFHRLAIAVIEIAILLTASRTALIVALGAFSFVILTWRESSGGQRASAVALFLVLCGGALGFAPQASRERLATLPGELTGGTLHNRTRIWKSGLKALKQHPLRGVGAGAYPEAVKPWLGVPAIPGHAYVAHNTLISVLVETGVVGFGIFTSLLAACTLFIWILPGLDRALWTTSFAIWAAGVFTLSWEQRKPTWLLIALLATAWAHAFRNDAAAPPVVGRSVE